MPLDEKSLRKPGFSEGHQVILADGQEWTLPKPRIRFKPQNRRRQGRDRRRTIVRP